jgi:hypothetical protein
MRKLLKIVLAAGVTALAARLIRNMLEMDAEAAGPLPGAGAPPPQTSKPGGKASSEGSAAAQPIAPSRDELYKEAARLDVKGRSKMNKEQLQEAVEAARTGGKG